MTDEEIVKRAKEAEKGTDFEELVHSPISKGVNSAFGIGFIEGMVEYRNYLQEEPVSEELEKASKEWLKPQLDKSYADYGETKMMELTHFDGYAMLDAIEFGAKWQKEQTISKACKWIDKNAAKYLVYRFVNSMRITGIDTSITEDFRKDMED